MSKTLFLVLFLATFVLTVDIAHQQLPRLPLPYLEPVGKRPAYCDSNDTLPLIKAGLNGKQPAILLSAHPSCQRCPPSMV